jgi:hypothetical protein
MDKNILSPQDDMTALEHYGAQERCQRMVTRRQLKEVTFAIQDFQAATGVQVPDVMATMCQKISAPMVEMALVRAMKMRIDAEEVQALQF